MIVISDCIKNNLDEGCIKIASSISKRLQSIGATLVAVNTKCSYADYELNMDKIFNSGHLYNIIEKTDGNILYIPFASNTLGSAVRTFMLSLRTKRKISVLFALRWDMNIITKILLKMSKANIITISEESYKFFKDQLKEMNVCNIKTGVDTDKFIPVDENKKIELRKKYNLPLDKTIVMHAGHLKYGRNVAKFLDISDDYHVVLVFSSVTEKDDDLRKQLVANKNIRVIEEYLPNIEEIYQASDVYLFPTEEENNSIDLPLSVLEAASCNTRIVSTPYKEIAYFGITDGLYILENVNANEIKARIAELLSCSRVNTRAIAKKYDWNTSIELIQYVVMNK